MSYSNNPQLPRVRMEAVKLVRIGWSQNKVARHLGYTQGAVSKWMKKAPEDGRRTIPTHSSRPSHHPRELPHELIEKIIEVRKRNNRCAEVVHQELKNEGVMVSLSSVKRTLKRMGVSQRTLSVEEMASHISLSSC